MAHWLSQVNTSETYHSKTLEGGGRGGGGGAKAVTAPARDHSKAQSQTQVPANSAAWITTGRKDRKSEGGPGVGGGSVRIQGRMAAQYSFQAHLHAGTGVCMACPDGV